MTLSQDAVVDFLTRNFVCGWTNIKGQTAYAGSSNTHLPTYPAMEVTNSSGHHNVQMFFLSPDARVLNCLPGYWNPRHLIHEAELALELNRLHASRRGSPAERNAEYLDLHLRHAYSHPQEVVRSSYLQGFDRHDIEKRSTSDFHRKEGFLGGVKTADQVLHERLAERPFVAFESFDVKKFIDMGLRRYQYDYGIPGKT